MATLFFLSTFNVEEVNENGINFLILNEKVLFFSIIVQNSLNAYRRGISNDHCNDKLKEKTGV